MCSPRFLLPLAVFLACAPLAIAGTEKVDSKITYKNSFEDLTFVHEGEVKSELKKCERDREVRLYGEGSDLAIAHDQTNRDGEYKIALKADGIDGQYYTRVIKEAKGSVVCKADESPHRPVPTR